MKFISVFAALATVFALHSCKPMPNDGVPFYLKIDSVTVSAVQSEGLGTHNIKDVWVESGTYNLGAYEVPCNFPVLLENQVRFLISAGIEESGQSNVRVIYPFYQPDTITIAAEREQTYRHTPVFRYVPGTQFPFPPENFDAGNGFNNLPLATDTNVRYGTRCGVLTVTATDSTMQATQIDAYPLPGGQEIWMEIDYKCEVPFYVGLYANFGSTPVRIPVVFINERQYWNKIYVKLSNLIGGVDADTYNIYFEALRPFGSNGGNVHIDNVKILHF